MDPLSSSYAWYSPYQYAGDKPIFAVDVDGLEEASANLTLKERAGLAVIGLIMATTGHPKEGAKVFEKSVDMNVSTTGGYRGPLADIGQKVVTSAGSTLGGGLHTVTAGAWPLDLSATLGFTPAINPDASNMGQLGGAFIPSPFHGMPGANLELAPSGSPSALQLLNQTLHLPLTVYSNSPGTDENPTTDPSPGKLTIEEGGSFSESEVRAAKYMQKLGNDVLLRTPKGLREAGGTSDLLVNSKISYDVYTPTTTNPNRIISAIAKKNSQATGIIIDLTHTSVNETQLGDVLKRVQNAGATNITDIKVIGQH